MPCSRGWVSDTPAIRELAAEPLDLLQDFRVSDDLGLSSPDAYLFFTKVA